MSNILEIKGLSAGYGPLRVIHDLDLIIQSGERVGIVGLNGHGKTTLFMRLQVLLIGKEDRLRSVEKKLVEQEAKVLEDILTL